MVDLFLCTWLGEKKYWKSTMGLFENHYPSYYSVIPLGEYPVQSESVLHVILISITFLHLLLKKTNKTNCFIITLFTRFFFQVLFCWGQAWLESLHNARILKKHGAKKIRTCKDWNSLKCAFQEVKDALSSTCCLVCNVLEPSCSVSCSAC